MSHDNIKEIKPSKDLAIKCIAAVTDAIAEKFGYEYITVDNERGKWFRLLPYKADAEQIAIDTVANTLLTQTNTGLNHTNPKFIEQVLIKVANSLAQYTVRNPVYKMADILNMPENTDTEKTQKKLAKKAAYKAAEADTFNRLRNETIYLGKLEEKSQAHKAEEKIKRKMGTVAYNMVKAKKIRAAKACVEHSYKKDVQYIFKESNDLRHNKRK
ncbi:MAG: hypothetical protein IKB10_01290 [Alphaproteobacteria bacterium]|nr:hypothetical protein [Alphaproteobacteria bacterium]MBR6598034.1 hypothetical protein [Alphaproteobacteria bacterium]